MTVDIMTEALAGVQTALDAERRIWLVGVAHLVDADPERLFSEAEVFEILDLCAGMDTFPTGPVGYSRDGVAESVQPDYRLVTLVAKAEPNLEMTIGFGMARFVAVGFTRSGHFDGHAETDQSAVLLSDMESVIADTYAVATATAIRLGYAGAIELAFTPTTTGPGRAPSFFVVGEEDGGYVRANTLDAPMEPIRHRFELSEESTALDVHLDLYSVALEFARAVGISQTQLVQPVDTTYVNDPLRAAWAGRQAAP